LLTFKKEIMNKLFTLIAAACCFSSALQAQTARDIDMEATLISVTPNKVGPGENFVVKGVLKYVGTTPIKITDTVIYGLSYGGGLLTIGGGSTFFKTPKAMVTGDTFQINRTLSWNPYYSLADSTKDFCLLTGIINRSADSARDKNSANNSSCVPHTRKKNDVPPAGIQDDLIESQLAKVGIYPNPAKNEVNVNVVMDHNSDVTIKVYDITGRLVINETKGTLAKGNHNIQLNTAKLNNGIYMYQVVMGEQIESGKITINK
jgi:hypothetical protein